MTTGGVKLYLIDASALITANNKYYPVDRVPEFWEWLRHMGQAGHVKVPLEHFEEVKEGPKDKEVDLLYAWFQEEENRDALVLDEEVDTELVRRIVADGYASDLTEDQVEEIGRDPFIVAYALAAKPDRAVVSLETSAPGKKRHKRKLPDVCATFGIRHFDTFQMNSHLGFKTGWKK